MASRLRSDQDSPPSRRKPATTPDGRENQLIAMAVDAVENRIRTGTASAQELVHYLKLGSSRERLEQERLELENRLTEVKVEALASAARVEELYKNALNAMRSYSGQDTTEADDDDD